MDHYREHLPLYIQIAEGLLERIESGELSVGARVPSERDLSKQLDVARMTVRQALQLLESQGVLTRKQGVGAFVAAPKVERPADQLAPFTRGMESLGLQPGATVLVLEERVANAIVARKLQIHLSAPVYYCQRVRSVNHEPIMVETFYLPFERFPNFTQQDLTDRSLYQVLESVYNTSIHKAEQSLEAVPATEYESHWLDVPKGAPLLREERLAFDQAGEPVEYAKDLYRGDRIRYRSTTIVQ